MLRSLVSLHWLMTAQGHIWQQENIQNMVSKSVVMADGPVPPPSKATNKKPRRRPRSTKPGDSKSGMCENPAEPHNTEQLNAGSSTEPRSRTRKGKGKGKAGPNPPHPTSVPLVQPDNETSSIIANILKEVGTKGASIKPEDVPSVRNGAESNKKSRKDNAETNQAMRAAVVLVTEDNQVLLVPNGNTVVCPSAGLDESADGGVPAAAKTAMESVLGEGHNFSIGKKLGSLEERPATGGHGRVRTVYHVVSGMAATKSGDVSVLEGSWHSMDEARKALPRGSRVFGIIKSAMGQSEEKPSVKDKANKVASQKSMGRQAKEKAPVSPVGDVDMTDYPPLTAQLITRLQGNNYECMVCCEVVKRKDAVHSCSTCYAIFHLPCLRKWIRSESSGSGEEWRCPGCQAQHSKMPKTYTCFCGKVRDPEIDPYMTAHSCGEICGKRKAKSSCPHPCAIRCHPGPCQPCTKLGPTRHCCCGKTEYKLRCGEDAPPRQCGQICGKKLACGLHECTKSCHPGDCGSCEEEIDQDCHCGKIQGSRRPCMEGVVVAEESETNSPRKVFSCGDPCGKELECGKHTCQEVCHEGPCKPCATTPAVVKTCPCGKKPVEELVPGGRSSCLDPIPLCKEVCGRLNSCGSHPCKALCHEGPCGDCMEKVKVLCKCRSQEKQVKCYTVGKEVFSCTKICRRLRSCGRHQCNVRCCEGNTDRPTGPQLAAHDCPLLCGKMLRCGQHRCDLPCHSGHCPPCLNASMEEVTCRCGKAVIYPPVPCGTPPPVCTAQCPVERPCGHKTPHQCHTQQCPPCPVLVSKMCVGGHERRRNVPCHVKDLSCGNKCGRPLVCGQHFCDRQCHGGPCLDEQSSSCNQPCGKPRETCEHGCMARCHPGSECPPAQCHEMVTVHCECRRKSIRVQCSVRDAARFSAVMQNPGETVNPAALHVSGLITCDAECETYQRNRKMAEALGVGNKAEAAPVLYAEAMRKWVRKDRTFVLAVEDTFRHCIVDWRPFSFPVMAPDKRSFIHELAQIYGLESISMDKEPRRSVAIKPGENSRVPPMLLSESKESAREILSSAMMGGKVLRLHGLTTEVTSEDIVMWLRDFSGRFTMKWIDDTEVLCLFGERQTAQAAMRILTSGSYNHRGYLVDVATEDMVRSGKSVAKTLAKEAKLKDKGDADHWDDAWESGEEQGSEGVLPAAFVAPKITVDMTANAFAHLDVDDEGSATPVDEATVAEKPEPEPESQTEPEDLTDGARAHVAAGTTSATAAQD